MFCLICRKNLDDNTLTKIKIYEEDVLRTRLTFEALTKKCLSDRLCENHSSEEIATYGEIQQDYHEGCPPTFAPPN